MGFLLLAIAALVGLMMTLKLIAIRGVSSSRAIIINYLIATIVGIVRVLSDGTTATLPPPAMMVIAVVVGVVFFVSMHLNALSAARAGLALTTIATRAALVIPIILSALLLGEDQSPIALIGVVIVVLGFVLIFYEPRKESIGSPTTTTRATLGILFPLAVFLMAGLSSFSLKLTQHLYDSSAAYPLFEPMLFGAAMVVATLYTLCKSGFQGLKFDRKSIIYGASLGICNFLTTYCSLQGLRTLPTTTFYPIYYASAVVITTVLGATFFGEKLSSRKIVGIAVALGAIVVISAI